MLVGLWPAPNSALLIFRSELCLHQLLYKDVGSSMAFLLTLR